MTDDQKNNEETVEEVQESKETQAHDQLDFSDLEDERECPFSLEERKRVLEALLFVSDKPIGLSQMVSAFGFNDEDQPLIYNKEVEEALKEYEAEIEEQNRGYRLHTVSGGYQLRTSEEMKPFLQNTIKARTFRLTGPTLETLAIVAYKQPITKSQVDDVRGVDSSHLIRGLMDKDLLAFAGKSELPGKPMLYKTTTKFLEIFGLRNLNELPSLSEIEALIPEGIGNEEEQEEQTLSQLTGKLSEEAEDSYSVSEEEHDKIVGELSQISTSTEFFEEEKKRERERKELEKAENIREALMVGEEVSDRDKRWLERFDEKLNSLEAEDSEENSEAELEASDGAEPGDENASGGTENLETLSFSESTEQVEEESEGEGEELPPLIEDDAETEEEDPETQINL